MTVLKHQHWFHALWWHFGPYGPQDVHVHSCMTGDTDQRVQPCDRVLIGPGLSCDGDPTTHHRETLKA